MNEVVGQRELFARLRQLPPKVQRKVVRPALRAAAKVIHAEAKQLVPVRSGALQKSLKVRAQKRKRDSIGVNVQTGEKFFRGPVFYGGFVEYGTRKMQGRHFMQSAFDRTSRAQTETMLRAIAAGVEREAATR